MNVSLTAEMAEFVESELAGGDYATASEVVRDALRLLRHDRDSEREKLAILKREIDIGLAAARKGELSTRTVDDILEEVLRERKG